MPTANLDHAIRELPSLAARVTKEAGKLVKKIAVEEGKRATGNGRMSGMRGARVRASARNWREGRHVARCSVTGVPKGAWAILTTGAEGHYIKARTDYMGGPNLRHPLEVAVWHPGVRSPRRAWRRVVERANHDVPELAERIVREAMR